jgi:hypothetical protein
MLARNGSINAMVGRATGCGAQLLYGARLSKKSDTAEIWNVIKRWQTALGQNRALAFLD